MDSNGLFLKSLQSWQALIDVIESHKNESGVCELSQTEIAHLLGKSQTRVSQMFKAINREMKCIQRVKDGYVVNHENYLQFVSLYVSTFIYLCDDPAHFFADENVVAKELGIKRETLQAAKTYLRNNDKMPRG